MNLKTKLGISLAAIIFPIVFVIMLFVVGNIKEKLLQIYKTKALAIAGSTAAIIDAEEFITLSDSCDMESPEFQKYYPIFQNILRENDIKYLYALKKIDDENFIYVLDGGDVNADDFSAPGDTDTIENYDPLFLEAFSGKQSVTNVYATEDWGELLSGYYPIKDGSGNTVGVVGVDIEASDVSKGTNAAVMFISLIFAIGGILVGIGVLAVVQRVISVRVNGLLTSFHEITSGSGDLTLRLRFSGKDEMAQLGAMFDTFIEKLQGIIAHIITSVQKLEASGELLASNITETAAAMHQIDANIHSVKNSIANQAAGVEETAKTIRAMVDQIAGISHAITELSAGIEESSSDFLNLLERVHATSEKLVQNAENIQRLVSASERGKTSMQSMKDSMKVIADDAVKMLEVSTMLQKVASQTNLLAMNAAIEAAHAGDAGSGFAVVAGEVRNLAESSGKQAKEFSTMLKSLKGSIDAITNSVDQVFEEFQIIDADIVTVSHEELEVKTNMETLTNESKKIRATLDRVNSLNTNALSIAQNLATGSKQIEQETVHLSEITQEIASSMSEMADGTSQISLSINGINDISTDNKELAKSLKQEVEIFTI